MENEEIKSETKKKSKLKWFILLVFIVLLIMGITVFVLDRRDAPKKVNKEEYKKQVDNYSHLIEEKIYEYLANYDTYPTWQSIKNNVDEVNSSINCDVIITNEGKLTIKNCKVDNLDYISDYKYENTIKRKALLYIYSYGESNYINYYVKNVKQNYGNLAGTYTCQTDTCEGFGINANTKEMVVYEEGKYYLINYQTNEKVKDLTLDGKFENVDFIYSDKKSYGLFVCKEFQKCAFYSFENDKIITDFTYGYADKNISSILDQGYFSGARDVDGNLTLYLINNKSGEIYKTINNAISIGEKEIGNDILYITYGYMESTGLFTKDFKPFTSNSAFFNYAVNKDNTITIENDNTFSIYDTKANKTFTSKEYKRIVKAVEDYVVVLDNEDNLKVVDLKDEEKASLGKITESLRLHPMISGWYTDNGKYGIYIVVEDTTKEYGIKGAGLEYYYIPTTNETGVIETEGVGGYAKPVLYLYPTKETNVIVSFEKPKLLTTTYPKYNYNWNVIAKENGELEDANGKHYYALYWEEEGNTSVDFSEGFYVTKDNAINFLEEKLSFIGLTEREADEFIMYWLPILEKNEKSLVYFELTEERESFNKLIINPKPDSLLRLAIHIKKVNERVDIKEEQLNTFKRKGFSAVEWGGVVH